MPEPYTLQDITCRCMQARYLMRPSEEVNDLVLGVIGRAQQRYPEVNLHLMVVMSNHMHLILSAPEPRHISEFMCHVDANIAKEIGRLHDWRGHFWERRYDSFNIIDHESLDRRLHYLLSHGVKEELVEKPDDWPGVNCVEALCRGKQLSGKWVSREIEYENSRLKSPKDDCGAVTWYPVKLTPLPGWEDLTITQQQTRWRHVVKGVEQEYQQKRKESKSFVSGASGVLAMNPHTRPDKSKKSPRPPCMARSREAIKAYIEEYRQFVNKYREMLEHLLNGDYSVIPLFPPGSFIPSFVYKRGPVQARAPA